MFALGQFELSICLPAAAIRAILSSADGKKPEERFFFFHPIFLLPFTPNFLLAFTPKVRPQSWSAFPTTP